MAPRDSASALAAGAILVIDGKRRAFHPPRTTLGRGRSNGIVLADPSADEEHCELVTDGRSLIVRDLGSSSGTFVNGRPVQQAQLRSGDELQVGTTCIRIEAAAAERPAPVPGAPFRAPAAALPAAIALACAAAIGGGWFALHRSHVRAARARYAAAARAQLATDPCAIPPQAVSELRRLEESIAGRTVSYAVSPARLSPPELRSNVALAQLYRDRAGSLDRMGDVAWRQAGVPRNALASLSREGLPAGDSGGGERIEQQLSAAASASETLANALRRSADESRKFAALLESSSRGGNVSPDDLSRLRIGASPATLQRTCTASLAPAVAAAQQALAEIDSR
jgi:FHA domain